MKPIRALAFTWLLCLPACAAPVEYHGREVGGGLVFWSVPGEISMGRKAIAELEAEGLPYLEDLHQVLFWALHSLYERRRIPMRRPAPGGKR